MRVLKWSVAINDKDVALPIRGTVLPVGEYVHEHHLGPQVFIWSVEPDEGNDTPFFKVFGTGDKVPDGYQWRATTPRLGGLVWHVFELVA